MRQHPNFRRALAALALLGLVACRQPSIPAGPGPSSTPVASTGANQSQAAPVEVEPQMIVGLNAFSQKIYSSVAAKLTGNLAVSPFGSYVLLGLLQEGAGGETRSEIEQATGLPQDGLKNLALLVNGLDSFKSLALAQKIYLAESVKLVDSFQLKVAALLTEATETVPLDKDPQAAVDIINGWVEKQTEGQIKDFLPPLPSGTPSVLVSALYFKGSWKQQFLKDATKPAPFHPTPGATTNVAMMRYEGAAVVEIAGADGVLLPYQEDFDMLFLLPKPDQSVEDLTANLDLTKLPLAGDGEKVNLELPRFEFHVPTFELTDAWKAAGLSKTVDHPDLSGMLAGGSSDLSLIVFHQTYVKVNEEGTEAAAATAVVVTRAVAMAPDPVRTLTFDRPFLFVLRHSGSGAILMLGRVTQPEEIRTRSGPSGQSTEPTN